MRIAKSEASGEQVDLVELARRHGAEAVEVADVHDAYKLLTGKSLPEPVPVPEAEMALDKDTIAALDAKYKEWQTRVGTEWATLVQLENAGRLPPLLTAMRKYAQTYAEAAAALHKRGMAGAAYSRMLAAWAFASATTQAYDILQKVQAGNIAGAVDQSKALDRLDETTMAVLQKIGTMPPDTLAGHLEMMAAFEAGLRGYVFKQMASRSIEQTAAYLASLKGTPPAQLGSPEAADKIMQARAPTLLYVGRTIAESTLATQELEFEHAPSVPYVGSIPNVHRMATSFQSAGAAGLETTWGEQSLAWALLSLAGSELAYDDVAQLIAKYDSLGVHTDDSGKVDKIEHDKAFAHMLATAERDGDLGDKLDALGEFWAASGFSQTAVMLARN